MLTSFIETKPTSLKIRRIPRGGYLVSTVSQQAYMQDELFACTDLDDALAFIKDQLGEPEKVFDEAKLTEAERVALLSRQEREKNMRHVSGIDGYRGII